MASDGLLRPIYEGCIAGCDFDIERRPYHKNCGCALHKSRRKGNCPNAVAKCKSVSYPMRRSWSEGCLALAAAAAAGSSSSPSSSCSSPSPAVGIGMGKKTLSGLNLCDEDEDCIQFNRI